MTLRRLVLGVLALTPLAAAAAAAATTAGPAADTPARSAHDFAFTAIDGTALPLSDFAGKVVLVVNTASRCGFTRQYADLQALWQRYRDRGLIVLGVPSNDFGGQEPGSEAEIKTFCETTFGIDFPMTRKVAVTGADADPFYQWASRELGPLGRPRWNFHKYLIAADGRLIDWFSTVTPPLSGRVVDAVEAALANAASR